MRTPWITVTVVLLTVVGGWLLFERQAADERLQPVGEVAIAATKTLAPALVWIAHDHGLFQEAGLEAKLIGDYSSGKASAEALLRGEVEMATAAEFLAARLTFTHPELRFLGTIAYVRQMRLIGLRERGIAAITDFAGKRVGVRRGTNADYFLARLLTLNGMARDAIEWVDLHPKAMGDALEAGEVDGVIIWSPFVERIKARLGERLVSFDAQPDQDYYYVLLTTADWVASHPRIANRVMSALKRADRWLSEHPEEGRSYLAAKYGIDPATMAETLRGYRYSVSLPYSLLAALEAESRWLEAHGTAGERVHNFLDLIKVAPLQAVSPTDVTLVR